MAHSLPSTGGRGSGVRFSLMQFAIVVVLLAASGLLLYADINVNWPVRLPTWFTGSGLWTGRDFIAFWAASKLAIEGQASLAYDLARLHAVEIAAIGGDMRAMAWVYPPPALLLVFPLALLPYPAALALWLLLPLIGLAALLHRLAPHPLTPWVAPLFTGILQCLAIGQNGLISAFLLGAGLLALERRPLLAGCCFGLLACKPQLALLVGPALLAGGHYRALAAMAATVLTLILASWIVFGTAAWQAFFAAIPQFNAGFESGERPYDLMTTVFAAGRLAGFTIAHAYLLQWVSTISALLLVICIWRYPLPLPLRGSALAAAIPLATPYGYNYDLALLSLPLAWLAWEGLTRGWRRGEFTVLVLIWLAPAGGWLLTDFTGMLVTPFLLVLLLAVIVRRSMGPLHLLATTSGRTT